MPRISFGSWGLAEWGDIDKEADIRLILEAYEKGLTFFDTAPVYGKGYAERMLSHLPKTAHISTKIPAKNKSPNLNEAYSLEWMHSNLYSSLERLERDKLDLVYLHNWSYMWKDYIRLLEYLKIYSARKIVNKWGISLPSEPPKNLGDLQKLLLEEIIGAVQIHYNLLQTQNYEIIKLAIESGKLVFIRSPLLHGLIPDPSDNFDESRLDKDHTKEEIMSLKKRVINETRGLGNVSSAVRFAISKIFIETRADSVIMGIRSKYHLEDAVALNDFLLG